jgi:hypothetical protein
MQCKECPWYKTCVSPMKFSAEDIRRQMEQPGQGMDTGQAVPPGMQDFVANMASAAQNSLLEGCPVFIERLRQSPELARRIKELMQNWGREEAEK